MAEKFNWPAEAEAYLRSAANELDWSVILAELGKRMNPRPSREAVYWWFRRNGIARKSIKSFGYWANDEVRAWLGPKWLREGYSAPQLADGVSLILNRVIEDKMIAEFCAREFGPREVPVRQGRPTATVDCETRTRRCNRCQEEHTMPRYRFTCDKCHSLRGEMGLVETYELVGARIV